jgi:predicted permease
MHVYLLAFSFPVKIDAQKDPLPAIVLFFVAAVLLWFLISQARRRDARKASGQGRRQDSWSRRPPRY